MRVDSGSINPNPVNPYNAATEKTVTARRSFQLRKKLAKRATGTQTWEGVDQVSMIGQWMSAGRGSTLTKNTRQASATLKNSKIR